MVGDTKGGVVGVPVNWVAVVQKVAAEATTEVIAEVIVEVITKVIVVQGVAGAAGAAIGVASSAAIGTTGGWVDQQYSKGPTGALLDSNRLCVLGGLIAIG